IRYQPDFWLRNAAHSLSVNTAHDAELQEVFRLAIRIRANVEHNAHARGSGKRTCQRGTIHATDAPKPEQCCHHRCASVARRNERVRFAILYKVKPNSHRVL